MDSSFDLLYNSFGQLHYDSYEVRLFNTYLRFSKELHDYGVVLQKEHHFLYDIDLTPLDQDELERYLELDKVVDFENFPSPVQANVFGYTKDPNSNLAISILQDLQSILDDTPLKIANYSIILIPEKDRKKDGEAESWKNAYSIYDIPVEVIREGDLEALEVLQLKQNTKRKD